MSMPKLSYDYVYNFFKENNCILLESEYLNNKYPMEYICSCGKESKIAFTDFRKGSRCKQCGIDKQTYSQNYIISYFNDFNYTCLDMYKQKDIPLNCICDKGHDCKISFNNFRNGTRCRTCKAINMSGENSRWWNSNRNQVKTITEIYPLCTRYISDYRKKYNITGRKINIDHIFPIKAFVEHNIYDLEIINSDDNLQILSEKDNKSKGAKYDKQEFYKYLHNKGITI